MNVSFGEYVKMRRKWLGVRTQAEMADLMGISVDSESEMERNVPASGRLRAETIRVLARALQEDACTVFEWACTGSIPINAVDRPAQIVLEGGNAAAYAVLPLLRHKGMLRAYLRHDALSEEVIRRLAEVQELSQTSLSEEVCAAMIDEWIAEEGAL